MHYDPDVSVGYRQHPGNLIGSNAGLNANLQRLRMLLADEYCNWNTINIAALEPLHRTHYAPSPSYTKHVQVGTIAKHGIKRILGLRQSGIYRQTFWVI